jgi:hypothetical protein
MAHFHLLEGAAQYIAGSAKQGGNRTPNAVGAGPGAYAVTVVETGEVYIGSTKNLTTRSIGNTTQLKMNRHCNQKLQAAYNANPEIEITVIPTATVIDANKLEQKLVDDFKDTGYLCNVGVDDVTKSRLGSVISDHQQQLMKDGMINRIISPEEKERRTNGVKAFYRTEKGLEHLKSLQAMTSKPVTIDDILFRSVAEAKRILKINHRTVWKKGIF